MTETKTNDEAVAGDEYSGSPSFAAVGDEGEGAESPEAEVTQEVTGKRRGRKPRTEVAGETVTVEVRSERAPHVPKLSRKTIAEMEAGREALKQYK